MGKLIWIVVLIGAGCLAWYGRHDLAKMFSGGDDTEQVDEGGESVQDKLREQGKNAVYTGTNDDYFHMDPDCPARKGGTKSRVPREQAEMAGYKPCPKCVK